MSDTPTIGHNQPPEELIIDAERAQEAQESFDRAAARTTELQEAANRWLTERPEIEDEDQAQAGSDYMDQLRSAAKKIEAGRKKEKAPYADAGKAVDQRWKQLKAPIDKSIELFRPILTAWLRKKEDALRQIEADRRADEERMRKEAEAKAEAARKAQEEAAAGQGQGQDVVGAQIAADQAAENLKAAEKTTKAAAKQKGNQRGQFGTRATALRTTWSGKIVDYRATLAHFYKDDRIREALQQVVNAAIRSADDKETLNIPGVEVVKEQKAG